MKKYILVLCFIFVNIWAFAQETDPTKDLENAIGGVIQYGYYTPNSNNISGNASLNFNALFKNDVMEYFLLDEKYNSDLKKSVFKKSSEYQVLLDSMNKLKLCRWKVGKKFYGSDWGEKAQKYNLKTSGYDIFMSKNIQNSPRVEGVHNPCPSQSTILYKSHILRFKQLSFLKHNPHKEHIPKNSGFSNSYQEDIFLPISEEEAVKMEEDKYNNVVIYFVFNIEALKDVTFNYVNDNPIYVSKKINFKTATLPIVETSKLRIIVINEATKYIYYDKIY